MDSRSSRVSKCIVLHAVEPAATKPDTRKSSADEIGEHYTACCKTLPPLYSFPATFAYLIGESHLVQRIVTKSPNVVQGHL